MFRITETLRPKGRDLCIDGRLTGEAVTVLNRKCRQIEGHYVLDLSGLQSTDDDGIKKLRKLVAAGIEFRGASPYIQLLIDDSD